MKKIGCIALVSLVGLLLLITVGAGFWAYDHFVKRDQGVRAAWSEVENQYQRRLDLLPNLVEVVKRYARHEQKIFADLADARARYAGAPPASPEKMRAARELETLFTRLMVIVENYPNLKANETFTRLMDEWAGTENRVAVARMRFNEQVKQYNSSAMSLLGRFWIGFFGFDRSKLYFEAVKGAEKAPSAKEMFGE